MSRLTDALMVLLEKCTPSGVTPDGERVCDILECLGKYYAFNSDGLVDVAPYVVKLTWNDSQTVMTADKGYTEVYEAFKAGKNIYAVDNLGCVWTPWCFGTNFAQFMHLRSGGQYFVVKLRAAAGECDLIRTDFDTANESQLLVTVTKTDGVYKADKTFTEIKAAADARKIVRCLCDGSYYDIVSATSNVIRFSRVLHRVSDDGTTIAEMSLVAVEINPSNGILVVGRGITTI